MSCRSLRLKLPGTSIRRHIAGSTSSSVTQSRTIEFLMPPAWRNPAAPSSESERAASIDHEVLFLGPRHAPTERQRLVGIRLHGQRPGRNAAAVTNILFGGRRRAGQDFDLD